LTQTDPPKTFVNGNNWQQQCCAQLAQRQHTTRIFPSSICLVHSITCWMYSFCIMLSVTLIMA